MRNVLQRGQCDSGQNSVISLCSARAKNSLNGSLSDARFDHGGRLADSKIGVVIATREAKMRPNPTLLPIILKLYAFATLRFSLDRSLLMGDPISASLPAGFPE